MISLTALNEDRYDDLVDLLRFLTVPRKKKFRGFREFHKITAEALRKKTFHTKTDRIYFQTDRFPYNSCLGTV